MQTFDPEVFKTGNEIWFYINAKDSIPTMRTTVIGYEEDFRGRVDVFAKGVGEPFPFYHFRKPNPETQKHSSAVPITECDDLWKRSGI